MRDELRKWIVNDYFTPNIKAEVIFDALLTRYIAGIIKDQCNGVDAKFITKEMSVKELSVSDTEQQGKNYGNRGTKIDYILADSKTVYLVELKTTDGSIEKPQAERYLKNCCGDGKTFGTVFGDKLLEIMSAKTGKLPKTGKEPELLELFKEILEKHGLSVEREADDKQTEKDDFYAELAKRLLKLKGWGSTYKYLYTMGQLLDYIYPNPKKPNEKLTLWNHPLKLIYVTPTGSSPHKDLLSHKEFYLCPDYLHPKEKGSVSLKAAAEYLRHQGDELAGLLADIIIEI